MPIDSTVTIKGLKMNQIYRFATAAYSLKEGVQEPINNRIGYTTEDIGVYHPLPINMLYGYIAKIAYQIQDYESARKAAKKCCNYFMEKTEVPELYLANQNHPLIEYKLKQEIARKFSDIEIRNAVEAFIVLSRCDLKNYKNKEENDLRKKKSWLYKIQLNRFKVLN